MSGPGVDRVVDGADLAAAREWLAASGLVPGGPDKLAGPVVLWAVEQRYHGGWDGFVAEGPK